MNPFKHGDGCSTEAPAVDTVARLPVRGRCLHLEYRSPFDATCVLTYLARRAVPGVEHHANGAYRRTIAVDGRPGLVEIELVPERDTIHLRLETHHQTDIHPQVQRCRDLLDLDVDPAAVAAVLGADPILAPIVARRPGLRVPGAIDGWELAVRAVLGQQVSVAAARTLAGRLTRALGTPLPTPRGDLTHLFPRPDVVAEADLSVLGITKARAATLQHLARAVASGEIMLDRGTRREDVEPRLLALPGIGAWTASYIAMRALGDRNAFLAGDLGVRRAAERLGLDARPQSLEAYAERWQPWRAYAVLYLWDTLTGGSI